MRFEFQFRGGSAMAGNNPQFQSPSFNSPSYCKPSSPPISERDEISGKRPTEIISRMCRNQKEGVSSRRGVTKTQRPAKLYLACPGVLARILCTQLVLERLKPFHLFSEGLKITVTQSRQCNLEQRGNLQRPASNRSQHRDRRAMFRSHQLDLLALPRRI